jgi:hypothetical protein
MSVWCVSRIKNRVASACWGHEWAGNGKKNIDFLILDARKVSAPHRTSICSVEVAFENRLGVLRLQPRNLSLRHWSPLVIHFHVAMLGNLLISTTRLTSTATSELHASSVMIHFAEPRLLPSLYLRIGTGSYQRYVVGQGIFFFTVDVLSCLVW